MGLACRCLASALTLTPSCPPLSSLPALPSAAVKVVVEQGVAYQLSTFTTTQTLILNADPNPYRWEACAQR